MSAPKTKTKYTSKGERPAVKRSVTNAVKKERTYLDKMGMKQASWQKGENPWVTVPNPKNETNKRFVRVRANDIWGDPKAFVTVLGRAGGAQ